VCGEPIPAAALRDRTSARPPEPGGWLCGGCRRDPPPFAALVVPWSYTGPIVEVVRGLKFGRLDYLGEHLAHHLAHHLAEHLARDRLTRPEPGVPDAVVPVPLHWRRRWARGYNQAERIARPLAGLLGAPCVEALRRRRATPPQVGLDRERRLANPRRAFAPRRVRPWPGRPDRDPDRRGLRAVLVDDVVTPGATLPAAAEALRRAGFSRGVAVAVARTPEGAGSDSAGR
jgi:predicted amidophosphoribosyltransferase